MSDQWPATINVPTCRVNPPNRIWTFVHAIYGKGDQRSRLQFVALTHLILRKHGTRAQLRLYYGIEVNPQHLKRTVQNEVHLCPLHPYEDASPSVFQRSAQVPSDVFVNTWLPKLSIFAALERDLTPGSRFVFLDADAVPTQSIDELFTMPLPPGASCLCAPDPMPTWQGNSGVVNCVQEVGLHAGVLSTFHAIGSRLGDGDQDILSYHFSRQGIMLHGRYNAFADMQLGPNFWRGRDNVFSYNPRYIKVVHHTSGQGAWPRFEARCAKVDQVLSYRPENRRRASWIIPFREQCHLRRAAVEAVRRLPASLNDSRHPFRPGRVSPRFLPASASRPVPVAPPGHSTHTQRPTLNRTIPIGDTSAWWTDRMVDAGRRARYRPPHKKQSSIIY